MLLPWSQYSYRNDSLCHSGLCTWSQSCRVSDKAFVFGLIPQCMWPLAAIWQWPYFSLWIDSLASRSSILTMQHRGASILGPVLRVGCLDRGDDGNRAGTVRRRRKCCSLIQTSARNISQGHPFSGMGKGFSLYVQKGAAVLITYSLGVTPRERK